MDQRGAKSRRADEEWLTDDIIELAGKYGRHGYRMRTLTIIAATPGMTSERADGRHAPRSEARPGCAAVAGGRARRNGLPEGKPALFFCEIHPSTGIKARGQRRPVKGAISPVFTELDPSILTGLKAEAIGLVGGAIFLGSWILQAWESRRAGAPVVSLRFFMLRALASGLLTFEGIRAGSVSVSLVMAATMFLMLYNASLILRGR